MIDSVSKWLVSKLDTVETLESKCFPTAAPVGDTVPPFAIYTAQKEDVDRDLNDDDGIRRAKIRLDLFDDDNDRLGELTAQVQRAVVTRDEDIDALYIYHAWADLKDAGFDLRMETHVQTLEVNVIYWRDEEWQADS